MNHFEPRYDHSRIVGNPFPNPIRKGGSSPRSNPKKGRQKASVNASGPQVANPGSGREQPLQQLLNDCDRLWVVAQRSFAVLVVFARCGLFLFLYIIGAKFFGAA
jgi:hypothetical protein